MLIVESVRMLEKHVFVLSGKMAIVTGDSRELGSACGQIA
jgi:hypothetical protein